jgi:hypothetical protein
MFSEQIELHGHIIDSLILPKVLDEILSHKCLTLFVPARQSALSAR